MLVSFSASVPVNPTAVGRALVDAVSSALLGKAEAVTLAVAALLAGGHVLVEDQPGVGKTSLAKALAASIGGSVGRIQGTPDLLPADITGFSIYHPGSGEWLFRAGPIFNDVVLFDEINRATPRAQSALLEAMAEAQATVDGVPRRLSESLFVIATQNPQNDVGTFPLSAGQRDRFAVVLALGLPEREVEREIVTGIGGLAAAEALSAVVDRATLLRAVQAVAAVHAAPPLVDYVLDLAAASRRDPRLVGLSPRGSRVLLRVAQAYAVLAGRSFVVPDDVQAVALAVLAHRLESGVGGTALSGMDSGRERALAVLASVAVPVP